MRTISNSATPKFRGWGGVVCRYEIGVKRDRRRSVRVVQEWPEKETKKMGGK